MGKYSAKIYILLQLLIINSSIAINHRTLAATSFILSTTALLSVAPNLKCFQFAIELETKVYTKIRAFSMIVKSLRTFF